MIQSALVERTTEIQARSRLNQNVVIDGRGLRIGKKVWIERNLLPQSIQNSNLSFCIALRGPVDLARIIQQISGDQELLSGQKNRAVYDGVSVTTKFSRALLVVPDFQRVRKFVSPPLGIERIAAFLRHTNDAVDVEIFDPNIIGEATDQEATGPDDPRLARNILHEEVQRNPYDLIGFSILTPTLNHDAQNLMRTSTAFARMPEQPVVVMGNYGVLLGAKELFEILPPLDAVVWGPGEYPLAAILHSLQHIRTSASPAETLRAAAVFNALTEDFTPAIMVARQTDLTAFPKGERFPSATPKQVEDLQLLLDQYAIDYEAYWATYRDKPKNLRFHVSTTSCPYGCIFCSTTKGRLSFTPVETVVAMFRHARQAYPEQAYPEVINFSFTDDNLFIKKDYLLALAEAIRQTPEWREGLSFYCQSRADSIDEGDHALLQSLRQTGFQRIGIGVESASPKALAELNKRTTVAQVRRTIKIMAEHGLEPTANLILFPPNVTLEDLYLTFKEALSICENPKLLIDPNFMLAAYSGAPLTKALEGGERSGSLTQAWVSETRIVYEEVLGLKIPHHFKIIRDLMEKLCLASMKLSKEAVRQTNTDANDLGRKGLMVLWSVISIVVKNPALFTDSTAGENTAAYLGEFNSLKDRLREVIRIRYPQEAEKILGILSDIENSLPELKI